MSLYPALLTVYGVLDRIDQGVKAWEPLGGEWRLSVGDGERRINAATGALRPRQ